MNNDFEFNTPVVYTIFNRPDCVRESFKPIREIKPKQLFIIADGPRKGRDSDVELCRQCREIVDSQIDWDCEVHRDYSEENMGCGPRQNSGYARVFESVDRAIFLEDDCVAGKDFFRFSQEMLEKYEDDERIYSVAGTNFGVTSEGKADYYFSYCTDSLGWATWKRVWDRYDFDISDFPQRMKERPLKDVVLNPIFEQYWYKIFNSVYTKELNSTWAYQFAYLTMMNRGLNIYPQKNLVKYIGFIEESTHYYTVKEGDPVLFITREPETIKFPLTHPDSVMEDYRADYIRLRDIYRISDSPFGMCDFVSQEVIEKIRNFKRIIIYGAGLVCKDVMKYLGYFGIDDYKIAVTDKDKTDKKVMGNTIYAISELNGEKDETIVIVAVSKEKYQEEMIDNLKKLGYKNYVTVM